MAVETSKTLRQRFDALSTPGKALVFVIPLCVVALAVAAIVVGGSKPKPVTPVAAEKPSATRSTESSVTTSMPELPPGHPAIPTSATAAATGSNSKSTSKSGSSSKGSNTSSNASKKPAPVTDPVEAAADKIPADATRPPGPLTEVWSMKIAKELAAAEERATAEADAKFPTDPKKGGSKSDSAKNQELQTELLTTYQNEITTKYKLTSDELIALLIIEVPSLQ